MVFGHLKRPRVCTRSLDLNHWFRVRVRVRVRVMLRLSVRLGVRLRFRG